MEPWVLRPCQVFRVRFQGSAVQERLDSPSGAQNAARNLRVSVDERLIIDSVFFAKVF